MRAGPHNVLETDELKVDAVLLKDRCHQKLTCRNSEGTPTPTLFEPPDTVGESDASPGHPLDTGTAPHTRYSPHPGTGGISQRCRFLLYKKIHRQCVFQNPVRCLFLLHRSPLSYTKSTISHSITEPTSPYVEVITCILEEPPSTTACFY